ncbi:cytochrome c oxidase assembly factor 1 homolog isoform X2 [Lepisosteus oculatus]|nr:PREDICTED: cytochrome c oxidase assembly factor 1 homolog isoform X2 [Lepisosteus oculatus]
MDQLRTHESAMGSLGAPPLQAHSIRLTDRHNRVDKVSAKIKIPVSGTKSSGYLYTSSTKDTFLNKWCLQEAVLHLHNGQRIAVFETEKAEPGDMDFENPSTGASF